MTSFKTEEIESVTIKESSLPFIRKADKKVVDAFWKAETSKNKNLHNGLIFIYLKEIWNQNNLKLYGSFIEYKYFYAQIKGIINLNIKPIGVTGITNFLEKKEKYMVLGLRNKWVTQYPNYFETTPSGSINKPNGNVNPEETLKKELYEEIGIEEVAINKIKPLLFIYDQKDQVYDICYTIEVRLTKNEINKRFEKNKNEEYRYLRFVKKDKIKEFTEVNQRLVPTATVLLKYEVSK